MAIISRTLFFGSLGLLLSCADSPSSSTAIAQHAQAVGPVTPVAAAVELGATPQAIDPQGIPRLLRGGEQQPVMAAANASAAARMHVERLAPAWGVRSGGMPQLEAIGEVRVAGGTIVRLRQMIDGIPVARSAGGEVRVMVAKDNSLVAASGKLVPSTMPRAKVPQLVDDDAGAVARAVTETYRTSFAPQFAPSALAEKSVASDGTRLFHGKTGAVNVSLARARKAWYPDGKQLTAAWVVEAYTSNDKTSNGDAYRTVIAADGRVLERTNLTADAAFRYRVFAESDGDFHLFDGPIVDPSPNATGVPNTTPFPAFVAPNLVTVDGLNDPADSNHPDPWLPAGSTETVGNNVDAYSDMRAPDGLSFGDFRATVTAPGTFDRAYDPTKSALDPEAANRQQMAGITSLFYTINWMHDFWYDAGFTEAAGNGQDSNFGRGGEDRDAILAEAQDNAIGGSRNNANMSTPADGLPPRMQVFVWTDDTHTVTVSGRTPPSSSAAFGGGSFDVTANVVVADDGTATLTDACTALSAPATGKIVLVDRGACSFKTKALNVQLAGGVAMLLANNVDPSLPGMGDDPTITTPITIGVLGITRAEGATLKTEIAAGAITATLHRVLRPELEGTLDASVVAHEFGHYLHHRLSQCNTKLCSAMSEGWADFVALLVMARPGDDLDKAFPVGVYSTRASSEDAVYYGIRRAPYSVSPAINSLSFRHMADGEALPTTHPFSPGGPNSEVHNGGEIWASMLWEGYVALQKAGTSFDDVLLAMREYVVAGLLLAPPDATPTETRDAILAAAKAASPKDHDVLAAAFARRGFGSCAVSPPPSSQDFKGIVEGFAVKGQTIPGALRLAPTANCDSDAVLDAGETAQITVPISNPGPVNLTGVTVKLTSADPSVTVATAPISIPSIAAYTKTSVVFYVQLAGSVQGVNVVGLTAEITSADGCGPVNVPLSVRVNSDDAAEASATDTFDAGTSVWTPQEDTTEWSHERKAPLDGVWFGADAGIPSDSSLTSPPLTAGSGALKATFTHRFGFEFGGNPAVAFDGGVIEISTDDGKSWDDVSDYADPGYNQTIGGDTRLEGRRAYGSTNAAFPETEVVTLDFGTKLAGKTFLMRFRVASDTNTGGPGWEIDNLAFTGLEGTPFPTLVANAKACETPGPDDDDDDDDGGCQTGSGSGGAGALLALAAAVLIRRRRR